MALQKRPLLKPCTECINEGLCLCLCNNSSKLDRYHLLQTNFTKKENQILALILILQFTDWMNWSITNKLIILVNYFFMESIRTIILWSEMVAIEKLNSFHQFLNSLDKDFRFKMGIAKDYLCFLDLKISIVNYKVVTNVYNKPKGSHLYLRSNSDNIQKP